MGLLGRTQSGEGCPSGLGQEARWDVGVTFSNGAVMAHPLLQILLRANSSSWGLQRIFGGLSSFRLLYQNTTD